MPAPEKILWQKLKAKQIYGYKFRRQYGVDRFVIDFYCPRVRLAIEIDGDTHYGRNKKADLVRQKYIESFKIKFLRFTNKDIIENIDGVLESIIKELTTPQPLLIKEGSMGR